MKLKVLEQLILLALISLVRNRSSCFFSVPVLVAFYSSTFAFSRLEQWSFPKSLDPFHGPRYQRRSASEVGPGCDHQKKGCLRTPHFPVSEAPLPRKGQPLLKCLTAMEHASRSKFKQPRTPENRPEHASTTWDTLNEICRESGSQSYDNYTIKLEMYISG